MTAIKDSEEGRRAGGDGRQAELEALVRDLARRYRALVARISGAELLADSLAFEIARLEELIAQGAGAPAAGGAAAAQREGRRAKDELRQLAESGVSTVEIKSRADGLADVRVDGGKEFQLPPALADLLRVLALDCGPTDDGLVGWKTPDEVAILLGKVAGRRSSRHGVAQNVYRLRRELFERGGANPFLVQSNRRRGLRFALRRRPSDPL
jgi:hypothetical protein